MSRHRKILTFTMIILVLAVLVSVVHHFQLRSGTEAYIARLKAEGEPLALAQVTPPPVPSAENGAPLITNALAQIYSSTNSMIDYNPDYNPPYDMNQTIPGAEMVGWRQPLIHGPDTSPEDLTNTWDELGAQLSTCQGELDDFRELIQKPTLDFHVDYSNPTGSGLMSHLPQIKDATQWLMTSEFYNLHRNETADACTDVRAMLALIKGETDERFEISQLVRFAIAQITADATWNILQTTNVPDQDLAQLQQDWQSLHFIAPLRNAFLFERVDQLRLLNRLRQSPTELASQVSWNESLDKTNEYVRTGNGHYVLADERTFLQRVKHGVSVRWDGFQWRWFWSYPDEVRALQMWQRVIKATRMLGTNCSFPAVQSFVKSDPAWQTFESMPNNPYAFFSLDAASQLGAIGKLATVETVRDIVITAIALKRYELRHQRLPASLAELVPDFVKSVPNDYRDGQPLHYRCNADGTFLLYSVGENGKDDGGNPHLKNSNQLSNYDWQHLDALDWVWPRPATPEEIQAYHPQHKCSD